MLCCVGLVAGIMVGQYFGGIWTFISPAIGFVLGLVGDMKLMKCHWGSSESDKCHKKEKVKKRKLSKGGG